MVHRHRHTSREEPAGLHDSGYVSVTETFWSVRPGAHIFVVATVSRNGGNGPRLRLSADPTGEGTTACTRAQTLDHLATRAARWAAGARATAVTGLVLTNAGLVLILTGFG